MQIIYDKLLLSEDYRNTSVRDYINDLADTMLELFPEKSGITIKRSIDDFTLDVKKMSSLGIIVNELITNAMKYAFKDQNRGVISITLTAADGSILLTVEDNGRGLPPGFDLKEAGGFGLMLVKMLSDQFGGNVAINGSNGTRCSVVLKI